MRRTIGSRTNRERARWRVGVLDSDPEEVGATLDIAVARFRELRRLRRALTDRPVVLGTAEAG